jgi:ABC-type anion transport system duplicated permease subunit
MTGGMRAPRLPVAVRRRIIVVVIVAAIAELAVEVWVIRNVTVAGIGVPVVSVLSGLLYLRSTRRRS